MKIKLLAITLFSFTNLSAQLRVDANGNVGIGTNAPNPGQKLHLRGDLLMTNYPSIPNHTMAFRLNNGGSGPEIAIQEDNLIFWETWATYHNLHAANYYKYSDSSSKSQIETIDNGSELIRKLRPVTYLIIDNKYDSLGIKVEGKSKQYGFISQEVRKNFKDVELTVTSKGDVLLDYDQIIPIAVAAIQTQYSVIDSLALELDNLKKQLADITNFRSSDVEIKPKESEMNALSQNSPNPFYENTEIKFTILSENFKNAYLLIFDMNGLLIKRHNIQNPGEGALLISGNELRAGMYLYTLIVNEKEVDSKKMILLN